MRVIHHNGFGHGLKPGTDHDMNCTSCIKEQEQNIEPTITGED